MQGFQPKAALVKPQNSVRLCVLCGENSVLICVICGELKSHLSIAPIIADNHIILYL